ncbi:uncharacterized protein LOC120326906 [Styela clava]
MGNSTSYITTSDDTSTTASTSSTFEMMRQLSYESDVFYPDPTLQHGMNFEKPRVPDLTPEHFPTWRVNEMNPVLLKYMKRSYRPCPATFKASAKKLAEISAAQKIPKFVNTMGGSQCAKLHWACLAGWCMCKYQYQPLTPLHLLPHTRLTSSKVIPSQSRLPGNSRNSVDMSPAVSSNDVTIDDDVGELYDDAIKTFDNDDYNVTDNENIIQIMSKESTV